MTDKNIQDRLFTVGDYAGGAIMGGATAAAVRGLVSPNTDMVIAMLIGMAVGMVLHLVIGLLLTPLLGMFHAMIPGSLIGMYGGMMFAMRDSMQMHPGSLGHAVAVGTGFGVLMIALMRIYDRALRGPVTVYEPARGE